MEMNCVKNAAGIKDIVARANLEIQGTVKRSEGGLPIGNGVTGTLVWTSPTALKTQINRLDVFANNSYSNCFNEGHLDYGYACGFVDIDFAGFGDDVFTGKTIQRLDVYRAEGSIEGEGASGRFFAAKGRDVFVFSCKTDRDEGAAIRVRMLRPAEVKFKNHFALSRFIIRDGAVILTQEFTEDNYYCASAIAVKVMGKKYRIRQNNESGGLHSGIEGRKPVVFGQETETETRLSLEGGPGSFDVYISSCATFDRNHDIAAEALEILSPAVTDGKEKLRADTEKWWDNFWQKSYIELWGDDDALLVEQHYQYFMYIMGSCSEGGKYPPNFGGLLFSTRGDFRHWGAMQWWNNLQLYYNAVMASGRYELAAPFFNQWNSNYKAYADAARQQWDTGGIYIPETGWFNGPELLPDDIASELRDLMLCRKPWSERSDKFWKFANKKHPFESRWNFQVFKWEKGELVKSNYNNSIFAWVTHMFGSQAGIARLYWDYYIYSGDEDYLASYGYPIIKGVAEFFRGFEHLKKENDGKYHIYHTNNSEGDYGSTDSQESLTAMYGVFPLAIKAAGILNLDGELAAVWKEILDNLAPLPVFDGGAGPVMAGAVESRTPDKITWPGNIILPLRKFELCTMETGQVNPDLFTLAQDTIDWHINRYGVTSKDMIHEMSGYPIALANLGRAEELSRALVTQINCDNAAKEYCFFDENGRAPRFENRLTAREGVNAMSAQRLGNVSAAIQLALLQSGGGGPALDPVIRLFPALPQDKWNARFRLHAAGGFEIEASCEAGAPGKALIHSGLGRRLTVRNVWGKCHLMVNGVDGGVQSDALIELDTKAGDVIEIIP
jgi:hypothetical protein